MTAHLTIREEIVTIVREAQRQGRPVTGRIVWGLLSREVCQESFDTFMSRMCKDGQLRTRPGDPAYRMPRGRTPVFYEPGDVPVDAKRAAMERLSSFMGNREHARLMDARKAARAWAKEGRKAA